MKDCICEIAENFETHHQVSTIDSNNNIIPKESKNIEIIEIDDVPESISISENENIAISATRHKKHMKKDKKHKRKEQKTNNQKVKVIKSQGKTIFKCSECGIQNEKITRIFKHYSRKHTKQNKPKNWLNCDQCEFKCLKQSKFESHKLKH